MRQRLTAGSRSSILSSNQCEHLLETIINPPQA
jgi:hypothetical protein